MRAGPSACRLLALGVTLASAAISSGCVGMRPVEKARAELPAPRVITTVAGAVHVEITGPPDGRPLALLHGFGGSIYSWREVAPAFAEAGWRVIALDLPGFGYSGRPRDRAAYTPEGQAKTVAEVLAALGVSEEAPAVLVGHSFGGGVALELAVHRPELLRALVLVDSTLPTFSRAPNSDWPLYRPASYVLARTLGLRRFFVRKALEKAYFDDTKVTSELVRAYRDRLVLRGPASAYRGLTSVIPRERLVLDLKKIAIPTLLIWGEEDALIPASAGRKAAKKIPGAKIEVFPECGHLPMEECPGAFLDVAGAFLTARDP